MGGWGEGKEVRCLDFQRASVLVPVCSQGSRTKEESVAFSFLACQTTSNALGDFGLGGFILGKRTSWRAFGGRWPGCRMHLTFCEDWWREPQHGHKGGPAVHLQMDETCSRGS